MCHSHLTLKAAVCQQAQLGIEVDAAVSAADLLVSLLQYGM